MLMCWTIVLAIFLMQFICIKKKRFSFGLVLSACLLSQRHLHFTGLAIHMHVLCHSWSSLSNEMWFHSIIPSPLSVTFVFLASHFLKATRKFPVTLGKNACCSSSCFIFRSRRGLWYLHQVPMTLVVWPCFFAFYCALNLNFQFQFLATADCHCAKTHGFLFNCLGVTRDYCT